MYKEEPPQTTLIFSEQIFDLIIPKDHILYRIDQEIDFSFVNETCKSMYSPNRGRRVVNFPERMFRGEIIQYMYSLSDRALTEQVNLNVLYRWFVGYSLDDKVFHWTAPGKFRITLGKDTHKRLFDSIIEQLIEKGLIEKNENQSTDATHIIGDVAIPTTIGVVKQAIKRALRRIQRGAKSVMAKIAKEIDVEYYIPEKGTRRTKGKKEFKMTDEEKRKNLNQVVNDALKVIWIMELALEQGELILKPKDERQISEAIDDIRKIFEDYIEEVPREVNGENGGSETGQEKVEIKYGVRKEKEKDRIVSTVDRDVRWGAKSDEKIFHGYKAHSTMTDGGFVTNIEVTAGNVTDETMAVPLAKDQKEQHDLKPEKMRGDGAYGTIGNRKEFEEMGIQLVAPEKTSHNKSEFPKKRFKFDEENWCVTCPAGKKTTKSYYNKAARSNIFHFDKNQCGPCTNKKKCTKGPFRTVSIHEDLAIQKEAMEYNATGEYKEDMKIRAHIEPKQAEMKRFHGLKRAIYRGLERVRIQAIYTAIVVNLKRMVTVQFSVSFRPKVVG